MTKSNIKLCCNCGAVLYDGGYSHAQLTLTGDSRSELISNSTQRARTDKIPFHGHGCCDSGCCLCATCYGNLKDRIRRAARID